MDDDAVHPDLWARIAALNQIGRVQLSRVGVGPEPKRWLVQIQHHTDGEVTSEDVSLKRALTAAMLAADARGWQ